MTQSYEYRTQSSNGEPVMVTAKWLVPQDDPERRPVLRMMMYVGGYDKMYLIDLPETETTKLAQVLAEGAF